MRTEVASAGEVTEVFAGDGPDVSANVIQRGADVEIHFNTRSGHMPRGVRSVLVAAVFELPGLRERRRLLASLPIGDAELLEQLRRRCESMSTRAAGATCLVDARLEPPPCSQAETLASGVESSGSERSPSV